MPARTDHDRRDAQHAARSAIAVAMGRYIRRLTEAAYAHIEEVATGELADDINWSAVGASAAHRALAAYGVTDVAAIVDGGYAALAAGSVAEGDAPDA